LYICTLSCMIEKTIQIVHILCLMAISVYAFVSHKNELIDFAYLFFLLMWGISWRLSESDCLIPHYFIIYDIAIEEKEEEEQKESIILTLFYCICAVLIIVSAILVNQRSRIIPMKIMGVFILVTALVHVLDHCVFDYLYVSFGLYILYLLGKSFYTFVSLEYRHKNIGLYY